MAARKLVDFSNETPTKHLRRFSGLNGFQHFQDFSKTIYVTLVSIKFHSIPNSEQRTYPICLCFYSKPNKLILKNAFQKVFNFHLQSTCFATSLNFKYLKLSRKFKRKTCEDVDYFNENKGTASRRKQIVNYDKANKQKNLIRIGWTKFCPEWHQTKI